MHIITDMHGVDQALEAIKTFAAAARPVQLFEIEDRLEDAVGVVAKMIGSAAREDSSWRSN